MEMRWSHAKVRSEHASYHAYHSMHSAFMAVCFRCWSYLLNVLMHHLVSPGLGRACGLAGFNGQFFGLKKDQLDGKLLHWQ